MMYCLKGKLWFTATWVLFFIALGKDSFSYDNTVMTTVSVEIVTLQHLRHNLSCAWGWIWGIGQRDRLDQSLTPTCDILSFKLKKSSSERLCVVSSKCDVTYLQGTQSGVCDMGLQVFNTFNVMNYIKGSKIPVEYCPFTIKSKIYMLVKSMSFTYIVSFYSLYKHNVY